MKFKIFIVLLLLFCSYFSSYAVNLEAFSEYASINGYVNDAETGETLIGATLNIQGTKLGAYTNKSGFFSITNIPPGKYTVSVSFIGYKKFTQTFTFEKNKSIRQNFKLTASSVTTNEVSVEADRDVEKREITISKVNIPMKQIKEIRIGGESDVFRSLQYLPGILTSSQLSTGLFVRGGSPDQNLVLVDGSNIYNPSHLFGFISTFNTEAIKDVELIKGGFPAEYGGRLSAVLNLTQKDGDRNKIHGLGSIGVISSRLSLEGPVGNGSWFIGGRRTYLELIKGLIGEDPTEPLPDYNFYDLNAKVTQDITENDKIFISGFLSADNMSYDAYGTDMEMELANKLFSARWTHIFSDNLFTVLNVSGSNYFNYFAGDQSGYGFEIENSITDYTIKGSAEWFISDNLTAKFGFETNNYTFKYIQNIMDQSDSVGRNDPNGLTVKDWNHSIYGQTNYLINDLLSVQGGLRVNYWDLSNQVTYDPRVAIRYQVSSDIVVKAAWGQFHQYLRLASQPDFSFFDTWLPTDSSIAASKAQHYIFSVETQPFEGYDLNFDVYYKRLYNVNEINTNALIKSLDETVVSDLFYIGDAYSYGAEIFLQKKMGRLTGWVGYAIGVIKSQFDSINYGKEFRPKYDRLHDLKIVAQYNIDEHWDIGGSFTFQTGQSYTGATSRFQPRLDDQNYGRGKIVPSQRYGLRLPPSHQLNVNVSYSFDMWSLPAKLILDIYNVYNRRDIWFRYYNTRTPETKVEDVLLLPIIPTISFEIKF